LGAIGRYWVTGGDVRWQRLHHQARRHRIALPSYPFEGKRYWIEPQGFSGIAARQLTAVSSANFPVQDAAPLMAVDHQGLIIALWRQLLGVDAIKATDNFFELGGDSLLASQVITRLRDHCAGEIALRAIFDHPTVEALACYLQAHAVAVSRPAAEVTTAAGERALTETERRYWYSHCFDPMDTTHHMVQAVKVSGPLRVEWLQRALDTLAARHAPLSTTFDTRGGVPYAAVGRALSIPMQATACADPAQLRQWIAQQARQPFDWAAGPLARGALARMGPDEHVWALIVHRIIAEPAALTAWVDEVFELHAGLTSGGDTLNLDGSSSGQGCLKWSCLTELAA